MRRPAAERASEPPAGLPAPLPRRLAAVVYEMLVLAAVLLVTGFLTLPLTARPSAVAVPSGPVRVLVFALVFGVLGTYCVYFWTAHRRTLAMKTWRLRLVRTDGATLDARRAVARYVAAWIGPVLALAAYAATRPQPGGKYALALLAFNFAWALVDRDRQFLHDRLAGTRIVREARA